jgi:hypothetical protein
MRGGDGECRAGCEMLWWAGVLELTRLGHLSNRSATPRVPRCGMGGCLAGDFVLQPELSRGDGPIVLVLAPTRELALQIKQE